MTGRSDTQAGFTLLELLVAVAILSLAVAALPGLFHFAERAMQTGASLDRQAAADGAMTFLERRLAQAAPVMERSVQGELRITFRGEADRAAFVATQDFTAEERGLARFELRSAGEGKDRAVVLSWSLWRPSAQQDTGVSAFPVRSRVLITNVRRFSLRYFGAAQTEQEPQWLDAWSRPDMLPDSVEISVETGQRTERRSVRLRLKPL
jgi:prepilin-type N-terminal cleavage/methylation domain-containing protein